MAVQMLLAITTLKSTLVLLKYLSEMFNVRDIILVHFCIRVPFIEGVIYNVV